MKTLSREWTLRDGPCGFGLLLFCRPGYYQGEHGFWGGVIDSNPPFLVEWNLGRTINNMDKYPESVCRWVVDAEPSPEQERIAELETELKETKDFLRLGDPTCEFERAKELEADNTRRREELKEAISQRAKYRAVLEGAEYEQLDDLALRPLEAHDES